MKTPKILPWIARRSGVPEARADALWAQALRYATDRTGPLETSDHWKAAMDRWLALIEAEQPVSGKAGGQGDQSAALPIQADRPVQRPKVLDSQSRVPADRRGAISPLRASCTIAVNFCVTHKSVSCATSAPHSSSIGAHFHDAECRPTCRLLQIAPAEYPGGGL